MSWGRAEVAQASLLAQTSPSPNNNNNNNDNNDNDNNNNEEFRQIKSVWVSIVSSVLLVKKYQPK